MATKKTKTMKKKKVKKKIDGEGLLSELQARFDVVEEKLDTLLSKTAVLSRMISTERDPDFKTRATVTKKFPIIQNNNPRERKMHKAVCAQCKQNCEVPFVPRANRPVYCRTCYSNRRNNSSPRNIPDREELVAEISKTLKIDITEPSKSKAFKAKKTKSKVSKTKKTKSKVSKAKKPKTKKTKGPRSSVG
ncbi:CxxC-x17-CxxC domain-containing protein [Candidatus Omnitrophota bacterium]